MAAYSALVSLKQDLERILSDLPLPGSPLTKEGFRTLHHEVNMVELLLKNMRAAHFFKDDITELVVTVKKGVEMLSWKKDFQKHHESLGLMDSLLKDSMGESYFQNQIRDLVISMKKDIEGQEPFLWVVEFLKLHDNIGLLESLLTDSLGLKYFQSRVREMIVSIKTKLDREFARLFHTELQKLSDNIVLMDSLLRDSSGGSYRREMMTQFQNPIKDVSQEAANCLGFKDQQEAFVQFDDSDSSQHIQERRGESDHLFSLTELTRITEEIGNINDKLKTMHKDREVMERKSVTENLDPVTPPAGSSSDFGNPSQKSAIRDGKLVGIQKNLEDMLNCLTEFSAEFKVFTITGMAGIGKTTFAKELYDHPHVVSHFDVRAWVTVSQEYQPMKLFIGLLSCFPDIPHKNESLGDQLYKRLKGRRYLITMDDVWDKEAWDILKRFLPNDGEGGRVILTTRLQDVAIYASPPNVTPLHLQPLIPEQSWDLLDSKVFAEELCPQDLLCIGREIASKCCGLPLAIVVAGGLLKIKRKLEDWKEIAQNVGSFIMDDTQDCQNIVALSYNHLPDPLRACFLYMGIFPVDYDISSKKLICLWIAEGFVQPNAQKSLEGIAEDYLEDLIARSLIMVKREGSNGRIKVCHIHDLLRDFCLRESQKEKFLHVIRYFGETSMRNTPVAEISEEKDLHNMPRLSLHSSIRMFAQSRASFPLARSFFCFEPLNLMDLKGCSGIFFKLLKVLDIMDVHLLSLPSGVLLLTNLKYMALTIQNSFQLSELYKLQSLQTCIIDGEGIGSLCWEFCDMSELRHFHLKRISPFPTDYSAENSKSYLTSKLRGLQNLQSLCTVRPESCSKEIFLSMPNLKKLGVFQAEEDCKFIDWFENLRYLTQLESLKYAFSNPFASSQVRPEHLPSCDIFLPSLKKLTLSGTSLPWEDMQQLGLLPKLEVLKLKNYAFRGSVWNLGEISFRCLKFLLIGSTNLEEWEADKSNFPRLQHLVLRHCKWLKEIPHGIGDVDTLVKIELHGCSDLAAASAMELQKDQRDYRGEELAVYITKG